MSRMKDLGGDQELKAFLRIEKEKLLQEVVEILKTAEYPLVALEITRRIFVKHFGEDWWKRDGTHFIFRRFGMRITQLLGMKDHGEANRKRLGIGYGVSDMPNHPLTFYLKKRS